MEFKCGALGCTFIGLTTNQFAEHVVQQHPKEILYGSQINASAEKTVSQGMHSMTDLEIAQFLSRLDNACLNEILYKLYTIKAVGYWNGIR